MHMILMFLVCFLIKFCYGDCPAICKCYMSDNLRKTSCVDQQLTTIEADVPRAVQFLDLSYNTISNLQDYGFKQLELNNLIVLNISNNMLSHISLRAFVGLEILQITDLSNNILQVFAPELFEANINLRKLYLSGNKFVSLNQGPFLESESLQILDISRCLIPHIYKETFSKLPNLTHLDISQNFLTNLNINVLENLGKLETITAYGNSWLCNSNLKELSNILNKNGIKLDNPCKVIERSQKIIVMEETTESEQDLWNYNDCDIETETQINKTTNYTCLQSCKFSSVFILMFTVIFISGSLFGIIISCTFIKCINSLQKRTKKIPKEEYLLAEYNTAIGLSTPVLNRIQHINNHQRFKT